MKATEKPSARNRNRPRTRMQAPAEVERVPVRYAEIKKRWAELIEQAAHEKHNRQKWQWIAAAGWLMYLVALLLLIAS